MRFEFEFCGVEIVLGRVCGFTFSGVVQFQGVFGYWIMDGFFLGAVRGLVFFLYLGLVYYV